jgi:hypothetical protein
VIQHRTADDAAADNQNTGMGFHAYLHDAGRATPAICGTLQRQTHRSVLSATGRVVFCTLRFQRTGRSVPIHGQAVPNARKKVLMPGGPILNKLSPFALIALVAAVLILQVLLRPALPVDETRALSVAWEMHLSGNPFLLTENFAPYSHKPPLLYWLINLVWLATGPSELAARLVGPAMALIVLALTARLAGQIWPEETGLRARATMVLAGFTFFILFAGTTMFDALLSIPVLLGALAIWRIGQGHGGRDVFLMLGTAFGSGVLGDASAFDSGVDATVDAQADKWDHDAGSPDASIMIATSWHTHTGTKKP